MILANQFRYPTYEKGPGWLTELVACMVDPEETPEQSMRREVLEESGYEIERLHHINTFYVSPGGSSERIVLYLKEAMRVAEGLGQAFNRAMPHYTLGEAYVSRGMAESAVPVLERGLAISQAVEGRFQVVVTMGWLGYARALLGRADEGVALLEQSLAQAEAIEFTGGMPGILPLQSHAYLRAGRRDDARASAQRGLEICRRLKCRGTEAEMLHVLGEIATASAPLDANAAEAHYRQAMALAQERDMRPLVAHCHLGLGKLYRSTSKRKQAREHLATATAMYREMRMMYWPEKADSELEELESG